MQVRYFQGLRFVHTCLHSGTARYMSVPPSDTCSVRCTLFCMKTEAVLNRTQQYTRLEFIWGQMHERSPDVPSPSSWGWRRNKAMRWEPHWTELPEAASCSGLLQCSCKKRCSGRCKCLKVVLTCTSLCQSGGRCGQRQALKVSDLHNHWTHQ